MRQEYYRLLKVRETVSPARFDSESGVTLIVNPSPSGICAVDTTGAGDIFGGSAMSQFIRCNKKPADLTEEEIRRIVRFACTAASLSTETHGGITSVPDFTAVQRKMESSYGN